MTEQDKENAFNVAMAVASYGMIYFQPFKKLDKKDFLRACEIYYDNAKDFKSVIVACNNLRHAEYIRTNPEILIPLMNAFGNPAIPNDAVQQIKAVLNAPPPAKTLAVKKTPRITNIYLMRNQRNGFIKIGQSENPKAREATLQSEEPEIKLLASWRGTVGDEKELHERFEMLRLRGEWFKLSDQIVNDLIAEKSQEVSV